MYKKYSISILSGVGLCVVGRQVHEALSYNKFIGTDLARGGFRDKSRLTQGEERAGKRAMTTSLLCAFVVLGGSGGSSY